MIGKITHTKGKKKTSLQVRLSNIYLHASFHVHKQDLQMRGTGKTEVAALRICIGSKDHLYPQFQKKSVSTVMGDCSNFGWAAGDSSALSGTRL